MDRELEKLMTVVEVAAYLRLNRFTVYRLVESGNIPGFKVASQWRFKQHELEAWLQAKRNKRVGAIVR